MVRFCYRWAGRTRPFLGVARLETAKNSVDARCMRQLVAAPPPRSACRPRTHTVPAHGDPQRHVLLARVHAQANPHHSRHCAPASAAERRQHRTRGRSGMMTPHRHRTAASHACTLESKVSPTHAAAGYGRGPFMHCQALSTSARPNARGARDAGVGHAAYDRQVCSGAKYHQSWGR